MVKFDPEAYGPSFAPFLTVDRRRPLDAGTPKELSRGSLESLSAATAFARARIVDSNMAECCLSGVWLLHDFLHESHTISQGIETSSGSFWHAIMHRREGDFSNSKYWLRRVENHPAYGPIGQRAGELAAVRGAGRALKKLINSGWDPFAFVDLCEAVVQGQSQDSELCLDIQQAEWELLFDHCYHAAIGDA